MATPTQQEFEHIVQHLMSADNNIRNQAEKMYEDIKAQNPSWLVQALMHLLGTSPRQELRQMCAVILRRALAKTIADSVYARLTPEVQQMVKQQLLSLLAAETTGPVKRSLAFCIGSLGSQLVEKNQWPELFPFLFTGVQTGDAGMKKSALNIFSSLATYVAESFMAPFLTILRDAFQFAMTAQQPLEVRIASVEAVTSLVSVMAEEAHVQVFQSVVGDILAVLAASLNDSNGTDFATTAVEALVGVAEASPTLFQPQLAQVFAAMLQIAATSQVEEGIRQLAIEFCLTYAETNPRPTKRIPQFLETLFPLAMEWVAQVEETPDWGITDDPDTDEITFTDVGLETLDRIALALGGKYIEPVVTGLIANFLADKSQWRRCFSALMSLSQIAEGCAKQLERNLAAVVQMVLIHFEHPHERVRYAAVHCLAQLCNDFNPMLQRNFHATVLPAIVQRLSDGVPRITMHAASCLVNFLDGSDPDDIAPHLDALMSRLLMVLQQSKYRFVSEEVLACFAAIAENSEAEFCKYYDAIVPYLKQVLKNSSFGKPDRMLRAKAIECVSLVGMSVGKEKFGHDVEEVMQVFHVTIQSGLEADDPQAQYILQAWARVAKCLGADFVRYLPHVMAHLLAQASLQTDVVITDATDDDDDENDEDNEDAGIETLRLSIQGVGEKKVQIKTSLLQDKALALSVIESLLEDVSQGMMQFTEQLFGILVPLLKFAYMGEVRETSAKCLPLILANLPPHMNKAEALKGCIEKIMEAVHEESDVMVAAAQMESFHRCISCSDPDSLPDALVSKCAEMTKKVFDESLRRRKNVSLEQKEVQDDEDEFDRLEAENEGEEELLIEVTESVGALVKTHRAFIPHFMNTFYPLCLELMDEKKYGPVEQRLALCALDDFIEHGYKINPDSVLPYVPQIIMFLLKFSASEDPDLAQASAFGLGLAAKVGGSVFKQASPEIIKRLVAICQATNADDEDLQPVTANAVASLVRIITLHPDTPDLPVLISIILSRLPVSGDFIEARFVHEQIVDWTLASNPFVRGPNDSNLPILKTLFAKLLQYNDETNGRTASPEEDVINQNTRDKIKKMLFGVS